MDDSTIQAITTAFAALSGWEVVATVLGITYVILAAKELIWCWPASFLSTIIYTVLFWEGQLPLQAVLNFFYIGMSIYGFLLWRKHANSSENLNITSWSWNKQVIFLATAALLSALAGYLMSSMTETRLPFLDASVMVFSMMNAWLTARKVIQTWIYWLFIDASAIALYWQTGFYVTIIMFVVYMVLAVYGYISWKKHLQHANPMILNNNT